MQRELGTKIPISIGTALPFEERITVDTDKPPLLMMNLRTLFRNFWSAFPNEGRPPVQTMLTDFNEELTNITGMASHADMSAIFYHNSYSSLERTMPNAKLKLPSTDTQRLYATAERIATLSAARALGSHQLPGDTQINGNGSKAWIMTHLPVDLLSAPVFNELTLIESHTGILKRRIEWTSKITKNENYTRLPFNELTIQVLGDRGNQFSSYSTKYKNVLMAIAKKKNWTPMTTKAKIRSDLSLVEDVEMRKLFLNMLNVKIR